MKAMNKGIIGVAIGLACLMTAHYFTRDDIMVTPSVHQVTNTVNSTLSKGELSNEQLNNMQGNMNPEKNISYIHNQDGKELFDIKTTAEIKDMPEVELEDYISDLAIFITPNDTLDETFVQKEVLDKIKGILFEQGVEKKELNYLETKNLLYYFAEKGELSQILDTSNPKFALASPSETSPQHP